MIDSDIIFLIKVFMSSPFPVEGRANYYVTVPRSLKTPVPGEHPKAHLSEDDLGPHYNCKKCEGEWARLFTFVRGFLLEAGDTTQTSLQNDQFFRSEGTDSALISRYARALHVEPMRSSSNCSPDTSLYFDNYGNALSDYSDLDRTLLVGIGEPAMALASNPLSAKRKVLILSALSKREPKLLDTLKQVPAIDGRRYGMLLVDRNFFLAHFSPVIPTGLFPRLAERILQRRASNNLISWIGRIALFSALPLAVLEYGLRVAAEKIHLLYVRKFAGEDEAALMEVRHKINQWTPVAACWNYQQIDAFI